MRHPTPAELHRLFQARMWREYAMAWDGRKTMTGVGREWVERVLRVSRAECLQRARAALTANVISGATVTDNALDCALI